MLDVLLNVALLGIASAFSPGILAFALIVLSGKEHPKERMLAFLCGGALVAILLAIAGSELGEGALRVSGNDYNNGTVALALGLLMMAFGVYAFVSKPGNERIGNGPHQGLTRMFAMGVLFNATNFDAILLNFTAVHQAASAGLALVPELLLIAFADFLFLSPALIPLIAYAAAPKKAGKLLLPVGEFMKKYGRAIVAFVFIFMGAFLIRKSLMQP